MDSVQIISTVMGVGDIHFRCRVGKLMGEDDEAL
jgi:hypothetical protein